MCRTPVQDKHVAGVRFLVKLLMTTPGHIETRRKDRSSPIRDFFMWIYRLRFLSSFTLTLMLAMLQVSAQSSAGIWVDSVIRSMSLEARVGQLFMIPAYAKDNKVEQQLLARQISRYQPGGLLFMQGKPEIQARMAEDFDELLAIPLLVAQDAEWGLGMRLKGSFDFPKNLTLGAIQDDSLLYHMGKEMARQLRLVGVHLNFAPILDVNNNPKNPVINYRSFGENRFKVARKGMMLADGMEAGKVMACYKHFPGHGDTDTDSHHDLPVLMHSRERLDSLELYPFIKVMRGGAKAIMTAHLNIPVIDPHPHRPASLSPIFKQLIRQDLNYQGLLFTDALNMKGVTAHYSTGEAAIAAFKAGNDVLLFPENLGYSIRAIVRDIRMGKLTEAALDQKVRRILMAKYRLGLTSPQRLPTTRLMQKLNTPTARMLRKQLYEAALTLAQNKNGLVPLFKLDERSIAHISVGARNETFKKTLKTYAEVSDFALSTKFGAMEQQRLMHQLGRYNTIILSLHGGWKRSGYYGIGTQAPELIKALKHSGKQVILVLFANPYALSHYGEEDATLVAYEDVPDAHQAAASAIFGGLKLSGKLPVTASARFREGAGVHILRPIRFGYGLPEEEGMDSKRLEEIDSLAHYYVGRGAMPGCAILVGRGNRIVYSKGFGLNKSGTGELIDPYYHLYDLASVTKVCATTLCVMKLDEGGSIKLDRAASRYLPLLKGSNKDKLSLRRILQHNAGLPKWRPFFRYTLNEARQPDPYYYNRKRSKTYNIPITDKLYASPVLHDTIWQWIYDLEVHETDRVRYSDIGMVIMGKVIEQVTGAELDRYCGYSFYKPLGMSNTLFNPALHGLKKRCVPSVRDTYWRHGALQGYVHDETAAIFGGKAGHAGLFSNVYDMAKLLFMLKNKGLYGSKRYFTPETIATYTRKQLPDNRKGLGWDKAETVDGRSNPVSQYASPATYGHTGFTGTCIWVDPEYDLIYVFLSNRTWPDARNNTLMREHVRTRIMDKIYEAIFAHTAQQHARID